jgi:hypothetical protein
MLNILKYILNIDYLGDLLLSSDFKFMITPLSSRAEQSLSFVGAYRLLIFALT